MDVSPEQSAVMKKLNEAKRVAGPKYYLTISTEIVMHPATRQDMRAYLPSGYMYSDSKNEYIEGMKVVIDDSMPIGELKIR